MLRHPAIASAVLAASLLAAAAAVVHAQQPRQQQQLIEQLEDEIAQQRRLLNDWGGLTRYGSENAELKLRPQDKRVVFLGDELIENWPEAFFASAKAPAVYFNRGIAHQTSGQMLVRFRQDVIGLKPSLVVIQAGMNDLAGYAGPATQGTIAENIMTMMDLAKAHGIGVVLASLTPVCDCFGKIVTERRPVGKILGLNGWLKDYAAETGAVFVDLYKPLVEGRAFRKDLSVDGVLPNEAGYARLAPVMEDAIARAKK